MHIAPPFLLLCSTLFTFVNIAGWILSSLVCVLLTVFLYPYLDSQFQSFVVRKLNGLNISSKHKLSGTWTHIWQVESTNFPATNKILSIEIKQFRNRIFAQYVVLDNHQKENTYQMLGRIKNDQVITGTWRDIKAGNRYHGCFQLYVEINEERLIGYWTGISSSDKIRCGKWEWIRE